MICLWLPPGMDVGSPVGGSLSFTSVVAHPESIRARSTQGSHTRCITNGRLPLTRLERPDFTLLTSLVPSTARVGDATAREYTGLEDARRPRPSGRRAGGGVAARGARAADTGRARAGSKARAHDGRFAWQGADDRARRSGLPEPPARAHRRPACPPARALWRTPVHGLVGARRAPPGRRHGALSSKPGRSAHREPAASRDAERHPAR